MPKGKVPKSMDSNWFQAFVIYLLRFLFIKYLKFDVRQDSSHYFRERQGGACT